MIETAKEKIVIVGFGWVGQANALALARMGLAVFYYDVVAPKYHYTKEYGKLYEKIKPLKDLLEVDSKETWYLICIGDRVSEDGFQDISLIEKALESLRPALGKIILRSTILPKYLEQLHFHVYLPEFLHEIYAVEECLNPFYFVLGIRGRICLPSFLERWEERSCKIFKGTPEEASYIKYLSNIWNALRVAFVNEFGDSIALPINEEQRRKNENIINFFFEEKSYLRYGKTFGGHCLPKDMRAFMAWKGEKMSVPLLKAIYEANNLHQQVVDNYTLPQWFSSWDYAAYRKGAMSFLRRLWQYLNSWRIIQVFRRIFKPLIRFIENFFPRNKSLSQLKAAWNQMAMDNPYYYSNSDTASGKNIDEFEARQTGQNDYQRYVLSDPIVRQFLGDFQVKTILEIGTGVGRMTEYFTKDFKHVYSIDISPVMLESARKRLSYANNISLLETAGNNIPLADEQVDLVFSYLVFKHLQNLGLVEDYLKDIARVLMPRGLAKLQFRTGPLPHAWQWFYGVSLSPEAVQKLVDKIGLQIIKSEVENSKSLWLWLQKKD